MSSHPQPPVAARAPAPVAVPADPQHPFDAALALKPGGAERFLAEIDPAWNVFRGPNGGYLAALLLHAMSRRLDDPTRCPRLLNVQYPTVPQPGAVEIHTRVERHGRSVSWLSASLYQGDHVCVTARAAFSGERQGITYDITTPPTFGPPEAGLPRFAGMPPFTEHFEYRSMLASPLAPASHSDVGGYIRAIPPRPVDAALLTVLSDAWFPSTFGLDARPVTAATLDLTVHFRNHAALKTLADDAFVRTVFRSRLAVEGYFEEDGELFAPDGLLLAQSRQLALATPIGA